MRRLISRSSHHSGNGVRIGIVRARRFHAVVFLVALSTGAAADDLWQRALDVVKANQDWFATSVVIEMEQLNSRGRVVDSGSTSVDRSVSSTGSVDETVTKSGKTPPDHETLLSGGLGLPVALRSGEGTLSIFVQNRQDDFVLSRNRGTEHLPGGIEAAVYQYSQPSTDGSMMRGRVWIDVETAAPVRVETIPDDPPSPLISSTTLLYFESSARNWYLLRLEMTGVARRMMIQREIRTTITLENYSKY